MKTDGSMPRLMPHRNNPLENEWSDEKGNSQLKYNTFEDKWEYKAFGEQPKYNPYDDR